MMRLIGMTRQNKIATYLGIKTATRRIGDRWGKVKKGDVLYVKNNMYSGYKKAIMKLRVTKNSWRQRVKDISPYDVMKEGYAFYVGFPFPIKKILNCLSPEGLKFIVKDFMDLIWDPINNERGYGSKKNPWVWVLEYEFIEALHGWKP